MANDEDIVLPKEGPIPPPEVTSFYGGKEETEEMEKILEDDAEGENE